jgi:oxygen-dependent protoporphyrinogen oxidase
MRMGSTSRRDFIRFIVAGSAAAGCPLELALVAAPLEKPVGVDGEDNEICHALRDGRSFDHPPVSARHDVVIVGGGVSGLMAAYLLRNRDFLILEKEPHWGGNAYLEQYEGMEFATGSAFTTRSETPVTHLAAELGLELLPVNDPDPTIIRGEFVPDTWEAGLDQLPYPAEVRASFKKFRDNLLKISIPARSRELDSDPFAKYCQGYAPEVKAWWDTFGPSNWGARTEETSAMLGIGTLHSVASGEPDDRVTWPGGLGAITQRLTEVLKPGHADRMIAGATVVVVEQQKSEAHVTYLHLNEPKTVAAKAVIMATPKFITWRLVDGLPADQRDAMKRIRYIPYPVVNLIFDKPVYNKGYDTWCPGNSFTDFVVADWTVRNKPSYRQKQNILTCYTPLGEKDRVRLLTEEGTRAIAGNVLRDFQKLFPGSNVDPVEVHIYRRGHPLYMSTPGLFTQVLPLVRRPMERIFFANTDSEGPISTTAQGITAAERAVREAGSLIGGRG